MYSVQKNEIYKKQVKTIKFWCLKIFRLSFLTLEYLYENKQMYEHLSLNIFFLNKMPLYSLNSIGILTPFPALDSLLFRERIECYFFF